MSGAATITSLLAMPRPQQSTDAIAQPGRDAPLERMAVSRVRRKNSPISDSLRRLR